MWWVASLLACGRDLGCDEVPGNVCALVGTGDQGFNGDDLAAEDAWLYLPTAVIDAPDGPIVVDYNNMRLRQVGEDGVLRTIAGNGTHAYSTPGVAATDSPLENPIDAALDPEGRLVISGSHEARVLRVGDDGTIEVIAGTGDEGDAGDEGPAPDALFSAELGGIVYDPAGNLYIVDTSAGCVRWVDTLGTVHRLVDGLSRPQGLAWDEGRLLIAEAGAGRILAAEPANGAVETLIDGLGSPYGVTTDGAEVYIADGGWNQVLRWDGALEVVAGTGDAVSRGDGGPAIAASFDGPFDVAFSGGRLLVTELRGARVRAIIP